MSWKKVIIYSIILIVFFISMQRIVINIIYLNDIDTDVGIVDKLGTFSDVDGYNSMNSFLVKSRDNKKYEGVYQDKDNYLLQKGDTVTLRKLHNGSVRVLSKNGEEVQSYYSLWDYFSVVIVLIMISCYFYLPKVYKKLKE